MDCCKYINDAARKGHLNCLIVAHKSGCRWDGDTTAWAANDGHLDCLKYLHENGCPWDELAAIWAVSGGHLDCLIYLHENGCSLGKITICWAVLFSRLNCLKYLYENKCNYDERIWGTNYMPILLYLHNNKLNYEPDDKRDLVLKYISARDAKIDAAKKERPYIPADIWNIIRNSI